MTQAISRDPIYRRRRFPPEIIEQCVRWYLTYRLSYRDLVEMFLSTRPGHVTNLLATYSRMDSIRRR